MSKHQELTQRVKNNQQTMRVHLENLRVTTNEIKDEVIRILSEVRMFIDAELVRRSKG